MERLIQWLLAGPVHDLVAKALAAGAGEDPLERMLVFGDRSRLHLDPTAVVHNALFNLCSGTVTVGEYAFFGHGVSVLTGTHDVHALGKARQSAIPHEGHDIVIGDGAWVASHAIVVGPVTIGSNAVVAVGSLVREDVAPFAIVAGVPAKVVGTVRPDGGP